MTTSQTLLPRFGQIHVYRAEDDAPMGCIDQNGADIRASRMFMPYPGARVLNLSPDTLNHDSIDAAVDWISRNPDLPDVQSIPYNGHHNSGVFGPVLARWGGLRILGLAHIGHLHIRTHLGSTKDMLRSPFVVMNAHHSVVGYIRPSPTGWNIVTALQHEDDIVRRTRKDLSKALALLRQMVVASIFTESQHARMQALADTLDFEASALAFHAEIDTLRLRRSPGNDVPVRGGDASVRVGITNVYQRDACMFFMGEFERRNGVVLARQHAQRQLGDRAYRVVAAREFALLDDAVHWLDTNPHAPDTARFPPHSSTYGPELWSLPGCTVSGIVGKNHPDQHTEPSICLQYPGGRGGYMGIEPTNRFDESRRHVVNILIQGDVRTLYCKTEAEAVDALVRTLVAEHVPGMPVQDVQTLHARITEFLHNRPQLAQAFAEGRGPHA